MTQPEADGGQALDEASWSHVKETINMLYLAVCQIEATMTDSNKSVDTLTDSFTKLATHTNSVVAQVQDLSKVEELASFKSDLTTTASALNVNINSSIQAFQFYDRVCQRLDHVARSLEKVSQLMSESESIKDPVAWRDLQNKIRDSYTMEAERIMFEYIMRGGSVVDALEIYRHHFNAEEGSPDQDNDEIELF
ncbi:conserved hypothetical protein [Teredinibacter turnerae T7901]|uniref:Uncharacterized protein n=1 Tax=Teredinibacter turnerae (strain ATCC 39867 / T7901) TaxID=377629 RepID=C5BL24_TERTT|nr:hypothetical protein [Teredinibacter turnerae]ACR12361.1 conserved hypothetical protein [Teredinibacter turnerae T7901]